MNDILIAVITGLFSLVGSILSAFFAYQKVTKSLEISQAVTDTKVEELTREVRTHNGFAQRMPVCEAAIENLKEDISEIKDKIGRS